MANGGGFLNALGQLQNGGFAGPVSSGSTQPAATPAQPQMNWQTGQPVAQPATPAAPAYQPTGPNTGWNTPMFATDPTKVSPTQRWWLSNEGTAATALENQKAQAAFNAAAPKRTDFDAGSQGDTAYNAAIAARGKFTPMTNQQALDNALRQGIKDNMGNYRGMMTNYNTIGVSQDDIQRAIGQGNDVYTYMNRPNYQQYSPNGQFNPTIYQSNYQNYNTGNPMAISQYGQGSNNSYARALATQMDTPFNPYANTMQTTPFTAPTQTKYYSTPTTQPSSFTPNSAIVGRSSQLRGTPNVVASKAEGGIASLMDKE